MTNVHYVVVEHDGGWAYKVGDVYSETFRTHEDAHIAAEIAAAEQRRAGEDEIIQYPDKDGHWRTEAAKASDRTSSYVEN